MDDPAWFPSEPPSWAEPDRAAIFAYNRNHRTGYADEDLVQDAVPVEPALSDAARRYANEYRSVMEAWNAYVEENGMPYEDLRSF